MMNLLKEHYISKRLLCFSQGRLRTERMVDRISDNHHVEKAELSLLVIQEKKSKFLIKAIPLLSQAEIDL